MWRGNITTSIFSLYRRSAEMAIKLAQLNTNNYPILRRLFSYEYKGSKNLVPDFIMEDQAAQLYMKNQGKYNKDVMNRAEHDLYEYLDWRWNSKNPA